MDKTGIVEEDEHIFDILTKDYDFIDNDAKVLSAQDLLEFYNSHPGRLRKFKQWLGIEKRQDTSINIYTLVKFFMKNNPDGHFIIDECPILCSTFSKRIKLHSLIVELVENIQTLQIATI